LRNRRLRLGVPSAPRHKFKERIGNTMQFSTDLPYGEKEERNHLESKRTLLMNVSKSADEAFVDELKTDPGRYRRLIRAQGIADTSEKWTVGTCASCDQRIKNAPFVERGKEAGKGQEYCSVACRDGRVITIPGRCRHCGLVLPKDVRKGSGFCDSGCKQANYRQRQSTTA